MNCRCLHVLALVAVLACRFEPDDRASQPPFEVCNGQDDDRDGATDEGFDIGSDCTALGRCGPGTVECAGPFGTRCSTEPGASNAQASEDVCNGEDDDCDGDNDEGCECVMGDVRPCGVDFPPCETGEQPCVDGHWRGCSGVLPAPEECNAIDDDCDGEADDGFGVGQSCELPGGCPGVRACSDDGAEAVCVVDDAALSEDVCDGRDNDCDGYVDATVDGASVRSACDCVEERLTFGAVPTDASTGSNAAFCDGTRPTCTDQVGELVLDFCLQCSKTPYAMCVSDHRFDLTPFTGGEGNRALSVSFTFESRSQPPTNSKSLVNLYYHADYPADPKPIAVRRYFRLLAIDDGPGSYEKTFYPEETCYSQTAVDCRGSETDCPKCRADDTCGVPTGSDCDDMPFESAQLQLAVEDGCAGDTFGGMLRIHSVSYGPRPCDH
jgi:hypothetical protein